MSDHIPFLSPPWGQQTLDDIGAMQEYDGVPPHWKIGQGLSSAARRATWDAFLSSTLNLLSSCLWPIYDRHAHDWPIGSSALRRSITEADLTILSTLQNESPTMLNRPISSPVGGPLARIHLRHFEFEDDSILGGSHADYDATLPANLLAQVPLFLDAGMGDKSRATAKQFKRALQRPRAYQMAYMIGSTNYRYLFAKTAHSPSMISGHGIAGLMGTGAVIDRWLKAGITLPAASWQALQQYAVDVGDRRVFAGVHYPADNLASWIVAMILGREVFESKDTLLHLAQAITQRSDIYGRILAYPGDAYKPALEEFHKLLP